MRSSYSWARLCGKYQVSMGVDKTRKNNFALEIEFLGFARAGKFFDAAARADGGDAIFVNQDGAVANDRQIIKRLAAAGNGAAQGEQLRAAGDEPVRHDAAILTPRRCKDYRSCAIMHGLSCRGMRLCRSDSGAGAWMRSFVAECAPQDDEPRIWKIFLRRWRPFGRRGRKPR